MKRLIVSLIFLSSLSLCQQQATMDTLSNQVISVQDSVKSLNDKWEKIEQKAKERKPD